MDIITEILNDVKAKRLSVIEAKDIIESLIRDEVNSAISQY